ncbi:MAG: GTP-binding protein [Gemmatimonadaceae bacterium]|nr:GTP-binding protein [Gemmatimonadaceae bacterium]
MMPLVLLVGFLGAGKTRTLTALIPALQARGLRPRVILNDFSNADVDASRLALLNALVTPLTGDCVCCSSLRELMDLLQQTTGAPGDVMLIEANGATETDELLGYLTMDQRLSHFTLPLQVTVIDVSRWQKRWFSNALEAAQARTATHVVLNWTDRIGAQRLCAVRDALTALNPGASVATADTLADSLRDLCAQQQPGATRPSLHDAVRPQAGHAPHGHTTHPYASATLPLPPLVDRQRFHEYVRSLPKAVVRAKGFVRFSDAPDATVVWNRVEGKKQLLLDASAAHTTASPLALFIGADLPMEELRARTAQLQNDRTS